MTDQEAAFSTTLFGGTTLGFTASEVQKISKMRSTITDSIPYDEHCFALLRRFYEKKEVAQRQSKKPRQESDDNHQRQLFFEPPFYSSASYSLAEFFFSY